MVALANATTNCFPMILISGSSDRAIVDLEQGDYEEMDQLAAARPYAKAAYRVNRAQDIGIGIARAIRAASSGRPGGVYLDLTAEVLGSALDAEGIGIEQLQLHAPSLDDVFLAKTGRSLEGAGDEEDEAAGEAEPEAVGA